MNGRLLVIAAAIFSALAVGVSSAQQGPAVPALGPLGLGMSPEAVRVALPQAAWTETLKSKSGVKRTLSAPAALNLLGATFDVDIEMDYHSEYLIRARRTVPGDTAACEKLALETITGLEAGFGRFERAVAGDFLAPCFNSPAQFCMKNIRTASTPGGSEVRRLSLDGKGQLFQDSGPNDRRIAIYGLAAERRLDDPDGELTVFARHTKDTCQISLSLRRDRGMLRPEYLPPDKLRFKHTPTMGARHNAAIQLDTMPPEGVTTPFACSMSRRDGGLVYCNSVRDNAQPKAVADKVRQAADQLVLDMTDIDIEDPASLIFDYDLKLELSDIRPLRIDASAALPLARIGGKRAVPGRALRLDAVAEQIVHGDLIKPNTVFGVLCEVMTDYSLACARPDASLLSEAGLAVASRVRMPEKLADGSPSVGRTVRVTLSFEVMGEKGTTTLSTR